jgi:hypothetical protein
MRIYNILGLYSLKNIIFLDFAPLCAKIKINYIVEKSGELSAVEIKWSDKRPVKIPKTFTAKYHPKWEILLNRENYADKLLTDFK